MDNIQRIFQLDANLDDDIVEDIRTEVMQRLVNEGYKKEDLELAEDGGWQGFTCEIVVTYKPPTEKEVEKGRNVQWIPIKTKSAAEFLDDLKKKI